MPRGRKPKPPALRVVDGNTRKRAPVESPELPPGIPACPAHLDAVAEAEWNRIAPLLSDRGILSEADAGILAAYAQAYGLWKQASEKLSADTQVVKSPGGYPIQNPWLAIANRHRKDMVAYAAELGITPAARGRVKGTEKPKNRLALFLAGAKKRNA